jgi:hypothetical protein
LLLPGGLVRVGVACSPEPSAFQVPFPRIRPEDHLPLQATLSLLLSLHLAMKRLMSLRVFRATWNGFPLTGRRPAWPSWPTVTTISSKR